MSHRQIDPALISVRAMIARVLNVPVETVRADARLSDLGLDDIDCMELALRIDRALGQETPDEVVRGDHTVAEV